MEFTNDSNGDNRHPINGKSDQVTRAENDDFAEIVKSFPNFSAAHAEMMDACSSGDTNKVKSLVRADAPNDDGGNNEPGNQIMEEANRTSSSHYAQLLASFQNYDTGESPLMLAAKNGHAEICRLLLEAGAPWNAVDRKGNCAGNYATCNEHWEVVDLLVEHGTRAELILGASIRLSRWSSQQSKDEHDANNASDANDEVDGPKSQQVTPIIPASHAPSTKPDYLQKNVRYDAANTLLLDDDDDAVMMEWERPIMNAHASILMGSENIALSSPDMPSDKPPGKRALNVGFGLGIIDTFLQSHGPSLHVIIEAHPTVYQKMLTDGWDKKPGVKICFGRWQDQLPILVKEGYIFDAVFYDTYGEHFTDLEDFHELMAQVLSKPNGIYSFFNGLAPDNLFFHGVACNCIKIQLSNLGLGTEFASCEIKSEKEWKGVRRPYWHGREVYYLPIVSWKKE